MAALRPVLRLAAALRSGSDFIGKHRVAIEPPDLFIITNDGAVSESDAAEIMRRLEAFVEGNGRVFVLMDVRRAGEMSPEGRKIAVSSMGRTPIAGIAVFGATFRVRALSILMAKAVALLYASMPTAAFFATEAEARAWLGERRAALEASG